MEQQPTFQGSVFSADRVQQWVVRANTFEDFVRAIAQMKSLLPDSLVQPNEVQENAETASASTAAQFCSLHQKEMKRRTGKDGQVWYDHRWKEGETWKQCNGERVRESA